MTDTTADLVAALEPFAKVAETRVTMNNAPHTPADSDILPAGPLTWGDVRRAQAALARAKVGGEPDGLAVTLTPGEVSQLLYVECRAVDNGGLLNLEQMNMEDRIAMRDMADRGLLRWDYLDAPKHLCGAWAALTPAGHATAARYRAERAERGMDSKVRRALTALQEPGHG
jgi:hypothetical protein